MHSAVFSTFNDNPVDFHTVLFENPCFCIFPLVTRTCSGKSGAAGWSRHSKCQANIWHLSTVFTPTITHCFYQHAIILNYFCRIYHDHNWYVLYLFLYIVFVNNERFSNQINCLFTLRKPRSSSMESGFFFLWTDYIANEGHSNPCTPAYNARATQWLELLHCDSETFSQLLRSKSISVKSEQP